MTDLGTTPRKVTPRRRLAIWERDKGRCQCCGRQLTAGDKWVLEHLRALELGGTNEDDNLAVYCEPCAGSKTKGDHSRAAKAKSQKQRSLGIRKPPTLKGAGFKPAEPQRKASKPLDKPMPPRRSIYEDVR